MKAFQHLQKHSKLIYWLVALFILLVLWFNSGRWLANKGFETYSPNKYYRLEFWHHPFYEGEGYIYIYNNQVNKRLATSQLFFMEGNSFTFWHKGKVKVGVDVNFKITPEPENLCCSPNQSITPLSAERFILSSERTGKKIQYEDIKEFLGSE